MANVIAPTDTILFTRGVPPTEALPAQRISEALQAAITKDAATVLQYGHAGGYPPLKEMLAADYNVTTSEVIVSNGSLHLQDILASVLIKPGAAVLVEQPSYDRSITTFRRRGARVYGVPLESDGVDIDAVEKFLATETPAFFYLVPDFQNPTGLSTSTAKREKLVALAEKYDFWLVEDVPYRPLRYSGTSLPLLRDIGSKKVLTISSYSKQISPALRVGYLIGPAGLVQTLTKLSEETILSPVLPAQAAVAEFRRRGWLEENLASLRALYAPRLTAMVETIKNNIPSVPLTAPEGGFFVSIMLPETANYHDLLGRAQKVNLILTDGKSFFAEPLPGTAAPQGERFVRLPFCAVTPSQIDEGVRRLAALL